MDVQVEESKRMLLQEEQAASWGKESFCGKP
jgi:hypothetical protein